ncbi:MAG TPA: hypothetical protein VH413_06955 [Verrucomicrobiae bacterium]|jgi:type II secretory pathway component PulJ|nr:hypothetical protein [Verrucomicrobiae bacterium]
MKNNQLTAMLVGLLFLSTLGSVALIWKYNSAYRTARNLEGAVKQVSEIERVMGMLSSETVEYNATTKNPDMTRLLQSFANKTAPKPAAK